MPQIAIFENGVWSVIGPNWWFVCVVCFIELIDRFTMRNMMSSSSSKSYVCNARLLVRLFAGSKHGMAWQGMAMTYKLLQFNLKRCMLPRASYIFRSFSLSLALLRAHLDLAFYALMNELIGLIYQWTSNAIICDTKSIYMHVTAAVTVCLPHVEYSKYTE